MKSELLIGCGSTRDKRLTSDETDDWSNLTTLDYNADHNPDVYWDLNNLPLPFADNKFDEIHAYEVLEHIGAQGDYKTFFAQFTEFWRILKPDGYLLATCPSRDSIWAYGDPSHTRIMQPEQLIFLSQEMYEKNVGKNSMSDFRNIYKADFETMFTNVVDGSFHFIIRAIKPSRIKK